MLRDVKCVLNCITKFQTHCQNPHERPVSHGSTAQQPDQASSRSSSSQSARVDTVSRPRTAYTESSKCVEEDDSDMLSHHGSEDSTSQPLTARSYTARPVSAMRRPRTALVRPVQLSTELHQQRCTDHTDYHVNRCRWLAFEMCTAVPTCTV